MILLSNNPNAHTLISKQLPIIDQFDNLKASMKDMAYIQQSLELVNNIFGKESLYASKYHYLLGTLFQHSLEKKKAYHHFKTALSITLDHSATDPLSKTRYNSNISLLKRKLDYLK